VSHKLQVTVTASNGWKPQASKASERTPTIEATAPTNTAPPVLSGLAREGETLRVEGDEWSGTQPITLSYTWEHCTTGAKPECSEIAGVSHEATSYELASGDVNDTVQVKVTPNSFASASVTSRATEVVTGKPPANVTAPTVTGTAAGGQNLTAGVGTWKGAPTIAYAYQWETCNSEGKCEQAEGADEASAYEVKSCAGARSFRVTVTATNSLGSVQATSGGVSAAGCGAVSWGENTYGALGTIYKNGGEPDPVEVETPDLVQVTRGGGLTAAGTVLAWGGDHKGGLGNGEPGNYFASWERPDRFVEVGLSNVAEIAAGGAQKIARLDSGELRTWGSDQYGQFGIWEGEEGENDREANHPCKPFNANRPLEKAGCPTNRPETPELPPERPGLPPMKAISIAGGGGMDFAVLENHEVYAWGSDIQGQLGVSEAELEKCNHTEYIKRNREGGVRCVTRPKLVRLEKAGGGPGEPIEHALKVVAGFESGYALLEDGEVLAWGNNSKGELGYGGETTNSKGTFAHKVVSSESNKPLKEVTEVAAGEKFALAVIKSRVWGWGYVAQGQLGEVTKAQEQECGGSTCVDSAMPLAGAALENGVEQIAAGETTGYALNGGEVYSWGSNHIGQLGDGEPISEEPPAPGEAEEGVCITEVKKCRLKPEPVLERSGQPLRNVRSVSAGGVSAFALVAGTRPTPLVTWTPKEEGGKLEFEVAWNGVIGAGEKLNFHPLKNGEVVVTGTTVAPTAEEKAKCAEAGEKEGKEICCARKEVCTLKNVEVENGKLLEPGMSTNVKRAFPNHSKIVEIIPIKENGETTEYEVVLNKPATRTQGEAKPTEEAFEQSENQQLSIPEGKLNITAELFKGENLEATTYETHLTTEGIDRQFAVFP
jgi:alpha-tubulin suppressor-like RCC1 family protein